MDLFTKELTMIKEFNITDEMVEFCLAAHDKHFILNPKDETFTFTKIPTKDSLTFGEFLQYQSRRKLPYKLYYELDPPLPKPKKHLIVGISRREEYCISAKTIHITNFTNHPIKLFTSSKNSGVLTILVKGEHSIKIPSETSFSVSADSDEALGSYYLS